MVCPKCNAPIKRFDLSPNCKNCGVHILYYTQEADLMSDAKKTELEFAKARAFTARLKAAFISGALPITRIVLTLLCVAVLCLPFFTLTLNTPVWDVKFSAGIIGVYEMINTSSYTQLFNLLNTGVATAQAHLAFAALCVFVLTVLMSLCILVTWILSFTNLKRAAKCLCAFSLIGALAGVADAVLSFVVKNSANEYSFISVSAGAGAFVAIVLFAANFYVNLMLIKKGQQINISEVDIKRIEVFKKLKAGEIKLDDLPLPIFETDEEHQKRVNALAGAENKKKKSKKKEAAEQ